MFSKGHNSESTNMAEKKNNSGQLIHIYSFETLAGRVLMIWHAQKSVTNGRTDERIDRPTNEGKVICPPISFEIRGIERVYTL